VMPPTYRLSGSSPSIILWLSQCTTRDRLSQLDSRRKSTGMAELTLGTPYLIPVTSTGAARCFGAGLLKPSLPKGRPVRSGRRNSSASYRAPRGLSSRRHRASDEEAVAGSRHCDGGEADPEWEKRPGKRPDRQSTHSGSNIRRAVDPLWEKRLRKRPDRQSTHSGSNIRRAVDPLWEKRLRKRPDRQNAHSWPNVRGPGWPSMEVRGARTRLDEFGRGTPV